MGSDGSVPWYNLPPRQFPARRWVQQRYGFVLPPLFFAQPAHVPYTSLERRPFPAKVWLERRQAGG